MVKSSVNSNSLVQPLLTDKYQISMCYGYWRNKKHEDCAVFDLYFRRNPFRGEYTIFAGLDEALKFISAFRFSKDDIDYLKSLHDYMSLDNEFWNYLTDLRGTSVHLAAMPEGSVCFPNEPLIRLDGPLGLLQLLETTILNLINYASLVATNASRYKMAAKSLHAVKSYKMLEFGLRRAQGPDGGLSASRYSYIGGFDGTSNLLAGKKFGIPVSGTMGHSFIMSYHGSNQLNQDDIQSHRFIIDLKTDEYRNLTMRCIEICQELKGRHLPDWGLVQDTDRSELGAFIAYAWCFPTNFLALVDTYDVIKSGLINFSIVALALLEFGYKPVGVRIDSGDLAFLSNCAKRLFASIAATYGLEEFKGFDIIVSNDIKEDTIICLTQQENAITGFGIGTHLVTCQDQPALGCVYKLSQVNGFPCMKLSSSLNKVNIPCKKVTFRLFGKDNLAIMDLICTSNESPPQVGSRVLCRHPFIAEKRCYVTPSSIEPLLITWWNGKQVKDSPTLDQVRSECHRSLAYITQDIKRNLNATPYKVAVSENLFELMNDLRLSLTPIGELC